MITEYARMGSLVIPRRFRGPRRSGNGGYAAGLLAAYLAPTADPAADYASDPSAATPVGAAAAVEVTLRQPPPLDVPLTVTADAEDAGHADNSGDAAARTVRPARVFLRTVDQKVIADAALASEPPHPVVPPVAYDVAREREAVFGGWARHPFPECFACGTDRTPGDGLCLRPGPVGDGRTACTWTPETGLTSRAVVWAVLDCPGGWAADVAGRPMVLGRITANVTGVPRPGRPYVVMGQLLGEDGRKVHTASAVYDEVGALLGTARHVWITVDPAAFEDLLP